MSPARTLRGVLEKLIERAMTALERLLALAFILAVCLNFANVVGRYGFGRTIAVADELQIYVMVWMTFLGAAVVSWRAGHLRMDVLAKRLPAALRAGLRLAEIALLAAVGGLTLLHSWRYTAQMAALGRASDVGGIPMWIPHGSIVLGFALMLLIALWHGTRLLLGKEPR